MERKLTLTFAVACSVSVLVLLGAIIFAGCATADPPVIPTNGCDIDVRKVCQTLLDSGQIVSSQDGLPLDRSRLDNASVRHMELIVPWQVSHATLRCVFDTQSGRITDGRVADGPQFSDVNYQWAKTYGYCK